MRPLFLESFLDVLEFVFSLWALGYVDILTGVIPVIVKFLGDDCLRFRVTPLCVAEVFGSYRVTFIASSMELAEGDCVLRVPGLGVVYECNE